jgi:hypothetical protein
MVIIGPHMQQVCTGFQENAFACLFSGEGSLRIHLPKNRVIGIDEAQFTRLSILQLQEAYVRQLHIHSVIYFNAGDIVLSRRDTECILIVTNDEIT